LDSYLPAKGLSSLAIRGDAIWFFKVVISLATHDEVFSMRLP
jgi:hypothetical protein